MVRFTTPPANPLPRAKCPECGDDVALRGGTISRHGRGRRCPAAGLTVTAATRIVAGWRKAEREALEAEAKAEFLRARPRPVRGLDPVDEAASRLRKAEVESGFLEAIVEKQKRTLFCDGCDHVRHYGRECGRADLENGVRSCECRFGAALVEVERVRDLTGPGALEAAVADVPLDLTGDDGVLNAGDGLDFEAGMARFR